MSLDERGADVSNTNEKSTKNQSATEWYGCRKCEAMDKNVHCHEVEAVEYLDKIYGDINAVTQTV